MLTARVTWTDDGFQFLGESGTGHAIVMDAAGDVGGRNTGMRPMELLLIGAGGCAGMDVVSILRKKKQKVRGVEVNVRGQNAQEYPKRFTDIGIEFIIDGRDISEDAVKKAIDLSMEKYCSVKATLEGSARVTTSYRIIDSEKEPEA